MLLLIHNASKWVERKIFMGERIYLFYFIEFSVLFDQRLFRIFYHLDFLETYYSMVLHLHSFSLTFYLCIFHSIICENASQSLYSCQDFSIENSLYIFLFKFPLSQPPLAAELIAHIMYLLVLWICFHDSLFARCRINLFGEKIC